MVTSTVKQTYQVLLFQTVLNWNLYHLKKTFWFLFYFMCKKQTTVYYYSCKMKPKIFKLLAGLSNFLSEIDKMRSPHWATEEEKCTFHAEGVINVNKAKRKLFAWHLDVKARVEIFQFIAKDEENTKSSQAMEELSLFWCLIIIYYQMSHRKVWRNYFLHLFSTMWALAMCWEGMFHWKTRHAQHMWNRLSVMLRVKITLTWR